MLTIRLFPPEADRRACLPLAGIRDKRREYIVSIFTFDYHEDYFIIPHAQAHL